MDDAKVISPAPRAAWNELIAADQEALVTQSPDWADTACEASGFHDASRLYDFSGGQRILLPLVEKAFAPGLREMASMPNAWGMGGVISARPPTAAEMGYVMNDLASQPHIRLSIRPNPLQARLWEESAPRQFIRIERRAHVLDLDGGFDTVWSTRFRKGARRAVQQAERRGVTVESDTTGRLVPDFYALFHKALERWARIQHEPLALARLRGLARDPMRKFETIMRRGRGKCKIWLARVHGQPAAAILVLQDRNAQDTRAVMDYALAGPTNANYLLERHAIEDACLAGCKRYHLGETGASRTLAFNKMRFGAQEYPYFEYRYERLPITAVDHVLRSAVKHLIGFRDVAEPPDEESK